MHHHRQRHVSEYRACFANFLDHARLGCFSWRSFSPLKRPKTHLRSIMGSERLSALALLHNHPVMALLQEQSLRSLTVVGIEESHLRLNKLQFESRIKSDIRYCILLTKLTLKFIELCVQDFWACGRPWLYQLDWLICSYVIRLDFVKKSILCH